MLFAAKCQICNQLFSCFFLFVLEFEVDKATHVVCVNLFSVQINILLKCYLLIK